MCLCGMLCRAIKWLAVLVFLSILFVLAGYLSKYVWIRSHGGHPDLLTRDFWLFTSVFFLGGIGAVAAAILAMFFVSLCCKGLKHLLCGCFFAADARADIESAPPANELAYRRLDELGKPMN